jgi:anti-sigma factor RsiW
VSRHLQPEQMNDLLLGIVGSETAAHLGACPQCRSEVEAMRQTLGSFRSAAVGWSEGAAKQVALPSAHRARATWVRPAWVLATAAIVLAVTIPVSVWRGHGNKAAAADAQAQISRDNQLLADIESDVGETTPTPMQPLQVKLQVNQ